MNGCTNCYRKSTLTATGFSATIPANGTLTFGTTTKITGNAIEMGENNTTINLKRAGLYLISVSATATGSNNNPTKYKSSILLRLSKNPSPKIVRQAKG